MEAVKVQRLKPGQMMEAKKGDMVEPVHDPVIRVPMGPVPGYVTRRVDIHRMSSLQSETLAKILSGLQFAKATLLNGTPVKSPMHAVLWMLENVK
jgi:hypothetical protein